MPKLLVLSVLHEIIICLQLILFHIGSEYTAFGVFKDLIVQPVFVKRMFLGGKRQEDSSMSAGPKT
ncbi:hypothetical protein M422DRAFT_31329 [Sphaerobolus stellatus SS14]|uniref:Uncharacterized protein n=1 Tax=Sphaerobolus stellatus (strain SS14) TaxID=990650 RepID=A0A0C9UH52_SPHS4|nr:hypothetical protein M422DRAFT_31329 [Sphaerobolus stellatus SS14]